jgi:hypothetical protein
MGKIHERFKSQATRQHTIMVDARVAQAAANQKPDTARRMSVFMADLDRVRADRTLDTAARHFTMDRLAEEARALGLKGRWNLLCNRAQCLRTPATWYNRGSYAFYCADCARDLSADRFNRREAERLFGGSLCINIGSAEEAAELHVMP